MWYNALKHASWLVKCPDDTPADVVKMRCNAANTIKRQWDKIERLEGENADLNLNLALWMGATDRDKRDLVAEVASLRAGLQAIVDRVDGIGRPGAAVCLTMTTLAAIAKQTLKGETGE